MFLYREIEGHHSEAIVVRVRLMTFCAAPNRVSGEGNPRHSTIQSSFRADLARQRVIALELPSLAQPRS